MSDSQKKPPRVGRVAILRVTPEHLVLNDDVLKGCAAVKALGNDAAAELLRRATPRRFRAGAKICARDTGSMLLLMKGEVRLFTEAGGEIGVIHRGEFLGDVGIGRAEGEVDVLDLPASAVESAVSSCEPFAALLESVKADRRKASSDADEFMKRW